MLAVHRRWYATENEQKYQTTDKATEVIYCHCEATASQQCSVLSVKDAHYHLDISATDRAARIDTSSLRIYSGDTT